MSFKAFTVWYSKLNIWLYWGIPTLLVLLIAGLLWWYLRRPVKYKGVIRDYYPDGAIKNEWTYKNGSLNGVHRLLRQDGTRIYELMYKADQIHGKSKFFYPDDTLRAVMVYSNNKPVGKGYELYPGGKVKEVKVFKKGELVEIRKFDEIAMEPVIK